MTFEYMYRSFENLVDLMHAKTDIVTKSAIHTGSKYLSCFLAMMITHTYPQSISSNCDWQEITTREPAEVILTFDTPQFDEYLWECRSKII